MRGRWASFKATRLFIGLAVAAAAEISASLSQRRSIALFVWHEEPQTRFLMAPIYEFRPSAWRRPTLFRDCGSPDSAAIGWLRRNSSRSKEGRVSWPGRRGNSSRSSEGRVLDQEVDGCSVTVAQWLSADSGAASAFQRQTYVKTECECGEDCGTDLSDRRLRRLLETLSEKTHVTVWRGREEGAGRRLEGEVGPFCTRVSRKPSPQGLEVAASPHS